MTNIRYIKQKTTLLEKQPQNTKPMAYGIPENGKDTTNEAGWEYINKFYNGIVDQESCLKMYMIVPFDETNLSTPYKALAIKQSIPIDLASLQRNPNHMLSMMMMPLL